VEIHIKSGDWIKHKHQQDANYDNVILHVVLEEDQTILDKQGRRIPCLELKKRISARELKKYRLLKTNQSPLPCNEHITSVPAVYVTSAIEKALSLRLEGKAQRFRQFLENTAHNWEYSFIIQLFRNFGASVNKDSFEILARSIPPGILLKEKHDLQKLEALIFGQSGFLDQDFNDEYPRKLQHIYAFQQAKYSIQPMQSTNWKFMRMRPMNFPTVRIAQLAFLIHNKPSFIDALKNMLKVSEYIDFFESEVSDYWLDHYNFDKKSAREPKKLSSSFRSLILINTVVPLFFSLGIEQNFDTYKSKALSILSDLPSEKNKVIKSWNTYGIKALSAYDSQGLLELSTSFCLSKQCLKCPVGHYLMKN